jgi:hypothetical protein
LSSSYTQDEIEAAGTVSSGNIHLPHDGQHVLIHYYFPDVSNENSKIPHQMMCLFEITTGRFVEEIYANHPSSKFRHINKLRYSKDGKYLFGWEIFNDYYSPPDDGNSDIRIWHTDNYENNYRIGANYHKIIYSFYDMPTSDRLCVNYAAHGTNEPQFVIYNIISKEIEKEYRSDKLLGSIETVDKDEKYAICRSGGGINGVNYLFNLSTEEKQDIKDDHPFWDNETLPTNAFWLENENTIVYYYGGRHNFVAIGFDLDEVTHTPYEILSKPGDLYPNPAQDNIVIPIANDSQSIELFDVSGNSIENLSINSVSGDNYNMDISHLPRGTYFVKVYGTSSVADYKFIKE